MFKKIQEFLKDKKNAKPIIFTLATLSLIMIFRHSKEENSSYTKEIAVEVAKVKTNNVPIYLSAIGTI